MTISWITCPAIQEKNCERPPLTKLLNKDNGEEKGQEKDIVKIFREFCRDPLLIFLRILACGYNVCILEAYFHDQNYFVFYVCMKYFLFIYPVKMIEHLLYARWCSKCWVYIRELQTSDSMVFTN